MITAKNTGLQPTMHVKAVGREADRAAWTLDHESGDPSRIGGQLVWLLPGVRSIDRVTQVATRKKPTAEEAAAAEQLQRAAALREQLAPTAPSPSGGGGGELTS